MCKVMLDNAGGLHSIKEVPPHGLVHNCLFLARIHGSMSKLCLSFAVERPGWSGAKQS